jgi:ABC-type glycerol-3-phosphate transport system permease component
VSVGSETITQPSASRRGFMARIPAQHRKPGRFAQIAGMLLLSLSAVFPLYFMLSGAFRTQGDWARSEIGLPGTSSIAAFKQAWISANIGEFVRNSAIVTSGTVVLTLLVAATAGYAVSQLHWPGRRFVYLFVISWLAVPPVALIVPVYIEMSQLHLINTFWSVILFYTAINTPFNVYLMTSYLKGLPEEVMEAAWMDGARVHSAFVRVIVPMARPALATLAVFNFLFAWNEFVFALLLLQTDNVKTATVGVLELQGRFTVNYPVLVAGLLIVSLPVIGIYLFFQRYLVRAIVAGAVK